MELDIYSVFKDNSPKILDFTCFWFSESTWEIELYTT